MRISKDEWAMNLAVETARRSTCLRRSVGCVLLNERGHVIATGYNGVAAGLLHCNERTGREFVDWTEHGEEATRPVYDNACTGAQSPSGMNLDGCRAIHAEQNALLQCKDVYQIHTCYVTTSPCVTCTKLLLNTPCKRIIFIEAYPHEEAADLWCSAGRDWLKFNQL